ncbi:YciI family protein [Cupriavidus sp. WGtm5]|uniref:YciI family protein n=1 Tax=Cupriavidus TaxID=106589 RepID=UPI000E10DC9F|nr:MULTISPECIES: YciI family protein [Cupriavidus]MCO4888459.1 YciI family protein [Cupriavidus sp. WGtm5]SPA30243.1 YCII-related protein [Cupriavidus taiwanensis]SPA55951.1 YCII-related protein [Cupriavidus taiwanensis]
MFYVIHAVDKPDALSLRLANYDAHKAYLAQARIKTLISGPLVADDGETMIGSFFLVEAENKGDAVAFNANDPFAHAGLWQQVSIHAFNKRVDNR